jgi:hypothetical protein
MYLFVQECIWKYKQRKMVVIWMRSICHSIFQRHQWEPPLPPFLCER